MWRMRTDLALFSVTQFGRVKITCHRRKEHISRTSLRGDNFYWHTAANLSCNRKRCFCCDWHPGSSGTACTQYRTYSLRQKFSNRYDMFWPTKKIASNRLVSTSALGMSFQTVIKIVIVQIRECVIWHFLLPLHDVSCQMSAWTSDWVSYAEVYTALLLLVLDLPISRSERKPVDKVQLSQQELKPTSVYCWQLHNKCA